MTRQGYFVTGTDTGCGKTEITLGLMARFRAAGERVVGMKPVASGAERRAAGLRNDDALRIQAAATAPPPPYELVNPCAFEPPIAPHLAALEAEREIALEPLVTAFRRLSAGADRVLVEGVGGWKVPLNDCDTVADLARALGLPVILVVGLRLGCINHALLSAESIRAAGCVLAGWVANQVEPGMLRLEENIATLER
ncbi:MAG TPA: dethiobiotin synthase, partial [Sedimenticola thiotaurini]|nr:dethiobiotin synthase [Sedimenticola thiotaurini]